MKDCSWLFPGWTGDARRAAALVVAGGAHRHGFDDFILWVGGADGDHRQCRTPTYLPVGAGC